MRKMFFGRIGVGKSTVGRKISAQERMEFIDCDKEVWNYYIGDADQARKSIREAIESGDKKRYKEEMSRFAEGVDWQSLFSKYANYEVSVLGNFYNIDGIPKEVVDQFDVYKIMCFVETRDANLKERGLDRNWVQKIDAMFEDPQGLKFGVIFNEDILGPRTPEPEEEENETEKATE